MIHNAAVVFAGFTAAQAAEKALVSSWQAGAMFTAAQAAEKIITNHPYAKFSFTAAQAAEKLSVVCCDN